MTKPPFSKDVSIFIGAYVDGIWARFQVHRSGGAPYWSGQPALTTPPFDSPPSPNHSLGRSIFVLSVHFVLFVIRAGSD